MSIAENKARYEGSAIQALMETAEHTVCTRCYCCELTVECVPCPSCCGIPFDDDEDDGHCIACDGEGVVYHTDCLGRCDDDGNHAPGVPA